MSQMKSHHALDLLQETAYGSESALNHPQIYLDHVIGVQAAAYQVAWELFRRGHDIDPDGVRTIALVHDLGRTDPRAYHDGDDVHELYTRVILEKAGFPEEADAAPRHFVACEKAQKIMIPKGHEEISGIPIHPVTFLQDTLPTEVLTYADSVIRSDGSRGEWEKKLESLREKYATGDRANPTMARILIQEAGINRLREICKKIDRMLD